MNEYTGTAKRVAAVSDNPRSDGPAKRVLMSKAILAHILKDYVKEFKDFTVEEIEKECIEYTYSDVPVDRDGLSAEFIRGLTNEDKSDTGKQDVVFDILFEATAHGISNEKIDLVINVEPQDRDSEQLDYDILTRARYYTARLLSRQKGQYFVKSNYSDIRKVYSIWIILTPNKGKNTVTKYEETPEHLYGSYTEPSAMNTLSSIIIIRLGKSEGAEGALKMLNILMTSMKAVDKLKQLENFGIEITRDLKREVEDMCDWEYAFARRAMEQGMEQGIAQGMEQGIAQGIAQGMEQGMELGMDKAKTEMVLNMLKLGGISLEKIAEITGFSIENIRHIQKENLC